MTQTLIGIDSQGVASVKISTDAYDPITTPDTTYGAWLYNSKFDPIRYLGGTLISGTYDLGTVQFFPTGTDKTNFQYAILDDIRYYFRNSYFSGLSYRQPMFQQKIKLSSGRFYGGVVRSTYGYQSRSGYFASTGALSGGWFTDWSQVGSTYIDYIGDGAFASTTSTSSTLPNSDKIFEVWNLPGNTDPILDPPLSPVSGQTSVIINSSTCRVAKPGYDANSATETQLAFDSAVLPIKVVAANDVAVPSGTSSVAVGAIPDDCLIDIHFYSGSDIYYPISPLVGGDPSLGADYWLSGGRLYFDNPYGGCRARFMVYANNGAGPTYGDNDVLRQFSDGGQDVVQFLRPGAGANPSFADIILDSRWPAVRIIKQGYIPITADGNQQWSVSFDAGGAWPFIKYMTVHGADPGGSFSSSVREPFSKILYRNSPGTTVGTAGDTSYCKLTQSEARFYTFRGAPIRAYYADGADYTSNILSYTYDDTPIQGIRYYIFGIPQP